MAIISKWQPGKLYQPGSIVIPNEGGAVTQVVPSNPDFESGDLGWTKQANWAINQVDAFQGTWSAEYAGASGSLLVLPVDYGFKQAQRTTNGTTFALAGMNLNLVGLVTVAMAANTGRFIAVNSETNSPDASYSTDGVTWNQATTIPWSAIDFDLNSTALWVSGESLFLVQNGQNVWLSADGDTWTGGYAKPVGAGVFIYAETIAGVTYLVTSAGRVYSSSDGLQTFSSVNLTTGTSTIQTFHKVGSTYHAAYAASANSIRWYTTTDITVNNSWTRQNAIETALEAVLTTPFLGNGLQLEYSGGTWVAMGSSNGTASTANGCATSTDDGVTWTARTSYEGLNLRYTATLGKFMTTSGGQGGGAAYLNTSTDGITWTQVERLAAQGSSNNGYVIGAPVELAAPDPIYYIINDTAATVFPGQTVRVRALAKTTTGGTCFVGLRWYDDLAVEISTEYDDSPVGGASTGWRETYFIGTAPADAATCAVVVGAQGSGEVRVDNVIWEYFNQAGACEFTYEATQATAAFSGTVEPAWPSVLGNTVVDNAVTWTARKANCITYEAKAILKSGTVEPTWPLQTDTTVADNTILWIAEDQRVRDENCPNTKYVAIAASKVFCGDDDIVAFCATVNPLDWTSVDDSGFIPFGLNSYGSQPVSALGLYRSNLVVWNNKAFQMWQVDEDPANFAILDAVPIGNPYYKSGQAVSNDLVFGTSRGIRSMGIAGASTNLQAGTFGKQIDPLIKAELDAIADDDDIISLYYPGAGQYWLIFEETAYVLTMNGGSSDMAWSTYVFPSAIDDWTILGGELYLRSGDKVWKFDEAVLVDDSGGANVVFNGEVWWPYLDFGALGQTKELIGFDTVADGEYSVVFGYNQSDDTHATDSYTISNGDTLYGDIIPMPIAAPSIQMRLTFTGNTAWEWSASTLYLQDWRRTS